LGENPVTAADIVAAVELVLKAIAAEPAIEAAVANVFTAHKAGASLTPALRHLEAVADAKLLGLNRAKV
jgi:hypothetical protein